MTEGGGVLAAVKKPAETICWKCRNANGNGCAWFKKSAPVRGWVAEKREIDGGGYYVESFLVRECPGFERGKAGRRVTAAPRGRERGGLHRA